MIITACTACLCLLIIVLGVVSAVLLDKLTPEVLGSVSGPSVASGIVALATIIAGVIYMSIGRRGR